MEVLTVLSLLIAILLVGAAAIYKKLLDLRSNIPSPGWLWFRQKYYHNFQDLLNFAEKKHAGLVHAIYTDRFRWNKRFFGFKSHALITHPDVAQIILKDEETFIKDPGSFSDIGDLMRESLVNLNGEQWKTQKEVMAPAFHFDAIKNAVPIFVEKSANLLDVWAEKGGKDLSIRSDMSHFTLDTLGLAAFNVDFKTIQGGSHEYLKAYTYLTTPDAPGTSKPTAEILKVQSVLSKMTYDIVASKQASDNQRGNGLNEKDILDRLLAGSDKLTKEQIRDNTFLMFLAGHETTSSALTWALYYLAKYPEIQKRAREEVDAVLNGRLPDAESVKPLAYLDMFIKEVLRHRPPVATIVSRIATKTAQVGPYIVPKDTIIGLSMYTIHHLKEFWPDPDTFDPLRFSPERSEGRHPFAYLPFSLGRRNCIGNKFSLLEQKIFLAMALQRITVSINEKCVAQEYPLWQVCWPIHIVLDTEQRAEYKKPTKSTGA
eukprot:Phypoly_transcript_05942.p1 GENE.Phypoly_transcript_05942~~Phypoly_transcript_05942.p1  ORF type:complete len:487 (-),score=65.26 Phypoly_transcript_05942:168-1628(-)